MAAIVAFACASAAVACGPEFPNSYYGLPEAGVLAAPEGSFASEIARIAADVRPRWTAVRGEQSTAAIELGDLRRALAQAGVAERRAREIEREYEWRRTELDDWVRRGQPTARRYGEPEKPEERPPLNVAPLRNDVPREFAEYFLGAVAWHQNDWARAREHWSAVLALPPEERRYRATAAAFMLGRAWLKDAEKTYTDTAAKRREARRFFAQTRELADAGFADPLGLAAESLGWEARAWLRSDDYVRAIELYLEQHAAGDDTALESLRTVARQATTSGRESLEKIAASSAARRVLTAHFISRHTGRWSDQAVPPDEHEWVATLQRTGVRDVPEADRMAWLAYEAGEFPLAWEWAALARADVPEMQWVRAKLALRAGDLQAGEKALRVALAAPSLGAAHRLQVAAELGRVCLARDDFAGALWAALQGGHWQDAAFVAERVMTVEELTAFVDAKPIVGPVGERRDDRWFDGADLGEMLRHLLARRLTRMGRHSAAEPYFPEKLQGVFRAYVADVQAGFDIKRPAEERAAAFWRAAQVAREDGMELLGTELEPDWSIWGGAYDHGRSVEYRRGKGEQPPRRESVFQPSALESQRLDDQRAPQKRFHYRYRAAELAWWAASLSPNDSEQTADMLATAGGWLKNRDPEAAKPFYQALVIRCGNTPLGRAAAAKRWFPETEKRTDADVTTREL